MANTEHPENSPLYEWIQNTSLPGILISMSDFERKIFELTDGERRDLTEAELEQLAVWFFGEIERRRQVEAWERQATRNEDDSQI